MKTAIRTETNRFSTAQEIAFAQRRSLSPVMRNGCRAAIDAQMGRDPMSIDLGFGEPVSVTQDNVISNVARAVALIVYTDDQVDSLFFVYRAAAGDLRAVVGTSFDMSLCLDGYLDDDRYFGYAWDPQRQARRQVFQVPDFEFLFVDADVEGFVAGAVIEDTLVSIGKMSAEEVDLDRVPALIRDFNGSIAEAARTRAVIAEWFAEAAAA